MPEPSKITVRSITGYPFRMEAETEDGQHILIYVKHDELFVTIGDQRFHGTMESFQMAQARTATPEVYDPTPPA